MANSTETGNRPGGLTGDRRAARREATRARLFAETVEEFRARGVADTEVAVVAERAGVSRSAFYVHYADKDAVLRELLIIEERRIADAVREVTERDGPVDALLRAVVDAVLAAEQRLGRRLVRDLCAAQFRPEFMRMFDVDEHPLGLMLVEELASVSAVDPVDLTMVFLTGMFGLLATDDAPLPARRGRLDLLIRFVTDGGQGPDGPTSRRT